MIEVPGESMKHFWLFLVMLILMGVPLTDVTAQTGSDGKEPIHITSDRFDAYTEKKMAVFSGKVVVVKGDTIITADEFRLYYKEGVSLGKGSDSPANAGLSPRSGDIEKIEAVGNVTIRQQKKVVTGEKAVLLNDEERVIITGNPVMKEGDNEITGDTIIFFMKENKGIVKSSPNQRVTATIYPEEKKD
jgi:lipopolysaccharide export system protein LptA